jgi:hypothetical protein
MRALILYSCFIIALGTQSKASEPGQQTANLSESEQTISQDEAHLVVMKALRETTSFTRLPKFGIEGYDIRYFPAFYFFEVTYDNPAAGSDVLGHYAVNRRTGHVWDVGLCTLVESASVRAFQDQVKARFRLSDAFIAEQRKIGPCDTK